MKAVIRDLQASIAAMQRQVARERERTAAARRPAIEAPRAMIFTASEVQASPKVARSRTEVEIAQARAEQARAVFAAAQADAENLLEALRMENRPPGYSAGSDPLAGPWRRLSRLVMG